MLKQSILALLLSCPVFSACALDVGDITSFIYSGSNKLTTEIKNTTNGGRLVNISVERISSPLEGAKAIPMESKDEILLTPASLLMPAQSNEMIRFFYNGPKDNKERYYRIYWLDQALGEAEKGLSSRQAIVTAAARISTILVVSPAKVNYDYQYANGKIINTGNASFKVISYGPCLTKKDKESCKESYYVLPGRSRAFSHVNLTDKTGRIAVWEAEKFVPVK
ncbi:hypothetical protein RABR111495_05390 [Rahnella bruchi]|uniref:EcpB family pilus assembly chaperone n=1 Tax=Rahnella bruchi TaxID=1510573 RepID=UPI000EA27491|nr:hypothetical protein [Rahnella bruchi]